jgi:putative ABC transport system permease protein
MIRDYVHLSFVSLKNRGLRSWLTIIGVFIGIAAVITLISLGQGLRSVVASQFNFLSTDILSVQASGTGQGPPGEGVVNPLLEDYIDDIEGLNGVDLAIGRIIEDAAMEYNGYVDFTFAGSMPDGERRREIERIAQLELDQGRMLEDHDTNRVVLGSNYGTDDEFGRAVRLRDDVIIQNEHFEVVGLLKKKGSFIVDNIILMNEPVMKDLFEANNTYDIILAKVAPGREMNRVKERIENFLRDERDVDEGKEDFSVESPEQEIKSLDATLFAIQIFIYVIAGISLLVGGIGIANTMFTSVVERTRQIGIMKSIGARRSTIFLLFLIESGLLGAVGGLLGILFGVGIAKLISVLGTVLLDTDLLKASVPLSLALVAFLFSFVIGSVSGILPALRASRLPPVEALRKVA